MQLPRDRFQRALDLIRSHLAREQQEPVSTYRSPAELGALIDLPLRDEGLSDDELFTLLDVVLRHTPRTTTRRFFNQLFGGRDEISTVAELLSAVLNISMYTFKVGGPHVQIERELTTHMARCIGYVNGEGVFTPGGSLANLQGMLLARNEARPELRDGGHDGDPMVLYTSVEAHYSVPKAAGVLGVGRGNVRSVAVDERGRMVPDALRAAIRADLAAGRAPFLVVATAGTTVLGSFDPLEAIAAIAREHGLWLHVDGALGGSMSLSRDLRHLIAGAELSDSFTWNAHKLLGVPLSSSVLLVREQGKLLRSLDEDASYLFQDEERELDLGRLSLQCGRRNDAFKLWAAWKAYGAEGLARRVERLVELARYAADRVAADPELALSCPPESVTVCFEVRGKPSDQVCQALRHQNRAIVGYAEVDGRRVIRLACVNPALQTEDLDAFLADVKSAAVQVTEGSNAVA